MADQSCVVLTIDALCTNQNRSEVIKLNFDNHDIANHTTVAELKVKIQDLINAPACDQKLSYMSQPLNDPGIKLGDLYVRHGDTVSVEYLEKAMINKMNSYIKMLKTFLPSLSPLCTSDGNFLQIPSINDVEKLEDFYADVVEPLECLANLFGMWKTVAVQADRHYFVQEKGLQCLMDILAFSQKKYTWFTSSTSETCPVLTIDNDSSGNDMNRDEDIEYQHDAFVQDDLFIRTDELAETLNEWQLIINSLILRVLWNFMETGPETRLVLDNGGLKLMIDAYLKSDGNQPQFGVNLSKNALGCLCRCVEYDPKVQCEVASNEAVMTKFVNMIDLGLSWTPSMQESCLVANTLFYLSFDQKALKSLIEFGFHLKIMTIVQNAVEQEYHVHLKRVLVICYYCLLFLARVRSATLISIPHLQAVAIDSYIDRFLQKGYSPSLIGSYEEELVYVWITLAPVVHMVFAQGPCLNEASGTDQDSHKDVKRANFSLKEDEDEEEEDIQCYHELNKSTNLSSDTNQECFHREWKTESNDVTTGVVQWPGSKMVQQLGIFALEHTLYSKDNLELLISEDLNSYLLCLHWQLEEKSKNSLARVLMVIQSRMQVPLLSLICKAVLARVNGLDAVRRM